jgi:uncharacterized protein YukE
MAYRSEVFDDPIDHETNRRRRARNHRYADKAAFDGVHWEYYPHHELYDMIMSANPAGMGQRARTWQQLADGITTTTDDLQRTIQHLFDTWGGTAAVRAGESITKLARWADEAGDRSTRIAAGLAKYTDAVQQAQRDMPPPEFAFAETNFSNGYDVKGTGGPSTAILVQHLLDDQKPDFDKHHAAYAKAVEVMRTYGGESQVAHNMTPALDTPQSTVQPGPLEPGQPRQGTPPIPGIPDPHDPSRPGPGNGGPVPSGVAGDLNGDGIPDGTTPGGYTSPGTGPGSGPGAGIAVGPGAGGAADVTRGGPGGGGFSGAGGGLAARGGAAGLAAGARGAAGANGFPPFGAGAGARRDEDAEHKNKFVEGLDLFDDLPPAYPPVFGA